MYVANVTGRPQQQACVAIYGHVEGGLWIDVVASQTQWTKQIQGLLKTTFHFT